MTKIAYTAKYWNFPLSPHTSPVHLLFWMMWDPLHSILPQPFKKVQVGNCPHRGNIQRNQWSKDGSYKNISSYSHLSYDVSRLTWLVSWSRMVIGTSRRGVSGFLDDMVVYVIEIVSGTPLVVHGLVSSTSDPNWFSNPACEFVAFPVKNFGVLPVYYMVGGCDVIGDGWFVLIGYWW